jgi:hypothetical protein
MPKTVLTPIEYLNRLALAKREHLQGIFYPSAELDTESLSGASWLLDVALCNPEKHRDLLGTLVLMGPWVAMKARDRKMLSLLAVNSVEESAAALDLGIASIKSRLQAMREQFAVPSGTGLHRYFPLLGRWLSFRRSELEPLSDFTPEELALIHLLRAPNASLTPKEFYRIGLCPSAADIARNAVLDLNVADFRQGRIRARVNLVGAVQRARKMRLTLPEISTQLNLKAGMIAALSLEISPEDWERMQATRVNAPLMRGVFGEGG